MASTFLLDHFLTLSPGQPFRLFPFGKLVKGGVTREITREFAARFRLPHFKPPIKLGSHEDPTPAGGHLVGLEVHADGLYGVPEWNEVGVRAMAEGAYRYQSPEVIWEDGGLEDPATGKLLPGPLIIGDALLHTPHLGEAAAMYSISSEGADHMNDTITVPTTLWDKLMARFEHVIAPPPVPPVPPVPPAPDAFTVAVKERDDLKAQVSTMQAAEKARTAQAALVAQLQDKAAFGSAYIEMRTAEEAATMMAGMTPEQRDWCMKNFKALYARIDLTALTREHGLAGAAGADDPAQAFNAAVVAKSATLKIGYNEAFKVVSAELPELFAAYTARKEK